VKELDLEMSDKFEFSFQLQKVRIPDCSNTVFQFDEFMRFGIEICESVHRVVADLHYHDVWYSLPITWPYP
jgi:hypothetical protein